MITLGDVLARYGGAYLQRYGERLPARQRRVLRSIRDCQTGRLGWVEYRCADCGRSHRTEKSCGDRHCPTCQTSKNGDWCAAQVGRLLPCDYFLVTFTIPSELRRLVRGHQRICYPALFAAAAHALRTALSHLRFCGAAVTGFTGILHTFGRDLNYHPHVHCIVPGGGLARDAAGNGRWVETPRNFLAPVKVLSQLYRAEFERILQQQGIAGLVAPELFRLPFIVDCQPVGDGVSAVKYLSRYVYRTALTNRRIVSLDDGHVTFRYRKRGATQDSTMRLPAAAFIARFLQHVLPRGLQKVRHYGFHSRASQTTLDAVRAAIEAARAEDEPDYELCAWSPPVLVRRPGGEHICSACGGPLEFVQVVKPLWRDTS